MMEKQVRKTDIKKGYLSEQALLHHLQALNEIPQEYVVHPRIVLTRATAEEMLRRAENPDPAPALRDLLSDGD
jgi:hypothetical protein